MSKKLPQISSDIPRDLRMFTDRLREIISANGDDRFVTAKELANAGVVKIERSGTVTNPTQTVNRPPAPQNVTVVGDIQTIVISWDAPNFVGFSMAEVWGNDTDDVNAAHKVGTSPGVNYRDPVGPLTSKYYWVRFVNTVGKPGPFASATGGLGETGDVVTYTVDDLKDDLAAGAVQVIAGAQDSNSIIKTYPTYMAFQHKDAAPLGSTGAYTGDFRTALGITSTGIIAGYNDKTSGAWQTTLAIESATGNLTVLGTIKANSIIQVGAYLGSQTVSSVLTDVSNASSDAADALSQVAGKLSASSSYTLAGVVSVTNTGGIQAGSVTWNSSTGVVTGGSGVVMTENGITGVKSGVVTFSIDNTGNAVFSGDINTGGDAYFEGQATTSYTVVLGGTSYTLDYSVFGVGATSAGSNARVGLLGRANSVNSAWNVGVLGTASNGFYNTNSVGVVGQGTIGGSFSSDSTAGAGIVVAAATTTSTAISIGKGYLTYNGVVVMPPDGLTDKYLRNDGTWVSVGSIGGGTVTSVAGTGTVGGITLSGTVTTSGNLTLSGTPSFAASAITSGTVAPARLGTGSPSTTTLLRGDGLWASIGPLITNINGNTGNLTTGNNSISIVGSTSTGIAGAYVGTAASGSTLTLDIRTTSPSDRRLKEEIAVCDLGLDFVNQLGAKSYKLINDPRHQKGYGFIADEVAALVGEDSSLVYYEPDWQVGDQVGFYTIHYPSYVAVLTKAIQELSAKVAQLEANNA